MRLLKHDQKRVIWGLTLPMSTQINRMNGDPSSDLCTDQLSSHCSWLTLFSPRTGWTCPHCLWGTAADLCNWAVLLDKGQIPETVLRVKQYGCHGVVLKHVLSLFSLLVSM